MISVKRADLHKALNRLAGVIKRRHRAPALTCVALEAEGGALNVLGTNLDIWTSSKIMALGNPEFACLLNHYQALRLIKACPHDDIHLSMNDNKVRVQSGKFTALMDHHDHTKPSDLTAPTFKAATTCDIDVSALSRAVLFVSTEETRHHLNGVHVSRADGVFRTTTTDGHRLFRATATSRLKTPINAIIPTLAAKRIIRMAGKENVIRGEFSASHCRVMNGDVVLIAQLTDGTFPDVDRVIPTVASTGQIRIDMRQLADAACRVSIGGNRRQDGVKVAGNGKVAAIAFDGLDFMGHDEIEAETAGKPVEVGFNADHLNDFAKIVSGKVEIQMFGGPGDPFLFNPEQSDDLLVLMPMRLS